MNSKDEKFVTIPFDVWENKYKVLEDENEKLKQQMEEKRIYIMLFGSRHFGDDHRASLGYIDVSIIGASKFEIEKNQLRSEIYNELLDIGTLSKDQAIELSKELDQKLEKLKAVPKFIKWLFKINL